MQTFWPDLIGMLFSCAVFCLGRWFYVKNERIGKIQFWAPKFAATYLRWAGVFFMVMGALNLVLLSVHLALKLI